MVAAVVAAVTCLVGAVVAWQLIGDLQDRSATSLELVASTLRNVDDSLAVAQDVTATVGSAIGTIEQSMGTLTQGVEDGAAALDAVADLTEDVPPALDRLDRTLVTVRDAAAIVDTALDAVDQLPIGPTIPDARLAASVDGLRGDIRPIAEGLRGSTSSIRSLAGSSGELVTQIGALEDDLTDLDESLAAQHRAARPVPGRHRGGDRAGRGEPGRPRPQHLAVAGSRRDPRGDDRHWADRAVLHRSSARPDAGSAG